MGIKWQRRAGDTDRFSVAIGFETDPDDGAAARPEMAASWGSFQLWVRGNNLCAHQEQTETVAAVRWYLLPLLEWFAANWQPLLHEEKLPNRNSGTDGVSGLDWTAFPPEVIDPAGAERWDEEWSRWWSRHALHACRDGGLFPDVVLRRFRDQIEISWMQARLAGAPPGYRFLATRGTELLEPAHVAAPLYDILREAVAFLRQQSPASARLERLSKRIAQLPEGSREERLAWMAGLGRQLGEMSKQWKALARRFERPKVRPFLWGDSSQDNGLVINGSSQFALMFGSISPTVQPSDVIEIAKAGLAVEPGHETPQLKQLVRNAPLVPGERDYDSGYALAEELLEALKLSTDGVAPTDIDGIYENLGIARGEISLIDGGIRAISIASPRGRPKVLINVACKLNERDHGRRFTLAHELCHVLHDRTRARELGVASGPWAPVSVERRANAFAAMLLMPRASMEKAIAESDQSADSAEGVQALAKVFNTGFRATLEHVGNLQRWDDMTRDRVRAEQF